MNKKQRGEVNKKMGTKELGGRIVKKVKGTWLDAFNVHEELQKLYGGVFMISGKVGDWEVRSMTHCETSMSMLDEKR